MLSLNMYDFIKMDFYAIKKIIKPKLIHNSKKLEK